MLSKLNRALSRTVLCDIADKCGTDKARHGYTRVYYELFKDLQDTHINILEIGVGKGKSLNMWQTFFAKANIFGIDIKHIKHTNCYKADQGNIQQVHAALEYFGVDTLDIVVDDGSHFQKDQQTSLSMLFPYLKKGGYYIIEDVATYNRLLNGANWGQSLDAMDSTDFVFDKYLSTDKIDSPYLTNVECNILEDNIADCYKYNESNIDNSPVNGTSNLIVIIKGNESRPNNNKY